ncbi:MAG: hypothetical protein ACI8SE_002009 [Bacteroidia bacterium]
MSTDYSHSIRNRLFLVLSRDELEFAVTDNTLNVLLTGSSAVTDMAMLEDVLSNTSPLSEIFSSVNLTWSGNTFHCYPTAFTNAQDQRTLFVANHKLRPSEKLLTGSLSADIALSYAVDPHFLNSIKKKYPNVVYQHEVEPLFEYVQSEIKPNNHGLILDSNASRSILLVKTDQQIRLVNQYDTKDINDVFYYVMLSIEQLELDIENATLFWISDTNNTPFSEIQQLFKQYVKNIIAVEMTPAISTTLATSIACG